MLPSTLPPAGCAGLATEHGCVQRATDLYRALVQARVKRWEEGETSSPRPPGPICGAQVSPVQ